MIITTEQASIDDRARNIGLIVGIPYELYMWTVSRYSTLYMEYINNKWIVWRETYDSNKPNCISYKNIACSNDFNKVLTSAKKYMSYVKSKRSEDK